METTVTLRAIREAGGYTRWVRDLAELAARAVWASVKALWHATAVWLAVAVLFVGGFVLGHVEASRGKREIVARAVATERAVAAIAAELDKAAADVRRLTAALAKAEEAKAATPATTRKGK